MPSAFSTPTLFVSHGSPMFALQPGQAGPLLQALGASLARPQAIAAISPHCMTRGAAVCTADPPQTIHDFGGFDPRLYQMHYPAPKLGLVVIKSTQLAIDLIAKGAGRSHHRSNGGWITALGCC